MSNKLNINKLLFLGIVFVAMVASYSFGQQLSNEKYNRIMVADGPKKGSLEIFVDPTGFECECKDVSSVVFIPTSKKGNYQSEDKSVALQIKGASYIVSVKEEKGCCFLKVGTYR
jgi:archaellum component FlaF (FlaF/FlaG flagellin family)